jgi:hypothetical protein
MRISGEATLGILLTLIFALGAGAAVRYPDQSWIGTCIMAVAAISLVLVAAHHLCVERHNKTLSLAVVSIGIATILLLSWLCWPSSYVDQGKFANFHMMSTDVLFNNRNLTQLIANMYLQNDAGDADVIVYSASALAPTTVDNMLIISQLRKAVYKLVQNGGGSKFRVPSKEERWSTIEGPVLAPEQMEKYVKGDLTFYFLGIIVIKEQGIKKDLENCGFVIGNNPRVIMGCPVSPLL